MIFFVETSLASTYRNKSKIKIMQFPFLLQFALDIFVLKTQQLNHK